MSHQLEFDVGREIAEIEKLLKEKSELEERLEVLSKELCSAKGRIASAMRERGVTSLKSHAHSFTAQEEEVPRVTDWDAFYRYVRRNNAFHLLHKRVSLLSWRELNESRKTGVPGIEAVKETVLKIRKV
jgi:hypothetical protein